MYERVWSIISEHQPAGPAFCWGYWTDTQTVNAKLHKLLGWFVDGPKMSIETLPCDVVLEVTVRVLVVCRSSEEGLVGGLDLFDPLPMNNSPSLFHRCSYIAMTEILEGDTDNNKLLFSQSRCMC